MRPLFPILAVVSLIVGSSTGHAQVGPGRAAPASDPLRPFVLTTAQAPGRRPYEQQTPGPRPAPTVARPRKTLSSYYPGIRSGVRAHCVPSRSSLVAGR